MEYIRSGFDPAELEALSRRAERNLRQRLGLDADDDALPF